MGGGGGGGGVKSGQASNTISNEFGRHLFYLLPIFKYHLLTEREVVTGNSQTLVSLCQYIEAEL